MSCRSKIGRTKDEWGFAIAASVWRAFSPGSCDPGRINFGHLYHNETMADIARKFSLNLIFLTLELTGDSSSAV